MLPLLLLSLSQEKSFINTDAGKTFRKTKLNRNWLEFYCSNKNIPHMIWNTFRLSICLPLCLYVHIFSFSCLTSFHFLFILLIAFQCFFLGKHENPTYRLRRKRIKMEIYYNTTTTTTITTTKKTSKKCFTRLSSSAWNNQHFKIIKISTSCWISRSVCSLVSSIFFSVRPYTMV